MNTRRTQCDYVICWLATGKTITHLGALGRWGVGRLAARIKDLREEGHKIATERMTRNGKTFARYRLVRLH